MPPKIEDNTIKDKVTVTSSNFGQNDGTIKILTHLMTKNHIIYTLGEEPLKITKEASKDKFQMRLTKNVQEKTEN